MAIARRYRVLRRRRARRARLFRQRTRVDDFRDEDFFCRFRFERATVLFLIDLLSPFIAPLSMRSHAISASVQVMAALRYYASGAHYRLVGDSLGISEASVSRSVRRVSDILCTMTPRYIRFPSQQAVKQAFYRVAGD